MNRDARMMTAINGFIMEKEDFYYIHIGKMGIYSREKYMNRIDLTFKSKFVL